MPIFNCSPKTLPGFLPGTTTVRHHFVFLSQRQIQDLTTEQEFADNGYRDGFSGLNNTEDSFLNKGPQISVDTRKVNAVRAYFEWMPIR